MSKKKHRGRLIFYGCRKRKPVNRTRPPERQTREARRVERPPIERQKEKKSNRENLSEPKDFLDLIAPGAVKFNTDSYVLGNSWRTVLAIRGYPTSTEELALLRHLGDKSGVTLSVYTRRVDAMEENKILHNASNKNRMSRANTNDVKQAVTAEMNLQDVTNLIANMQDEVVRTYTDDLPERGPLSQQKEFKPVRNMVIREVLKLSKREVTFDDEDMDDEPEEEMPPPRSTANHSALELAERYRRAKKTLYDEDANMDEKRSAIKDLQKLWDEGYTLAAHQLGKVYRDGLGVPTDWVKAEGWFRKSAEQGIVCSAYALGKLLLPVGLSTEAIPWLKYAADSGDQYARYTLGKVYLAGENAEKDVDTALDYLKASAEQGNQYAQYALGKLYLLGQDVPPDREAAVDYLTQSAEQGNKYAQFFLDHLNDIRTPSVSLAVLRMFHHMSNIFRDTTAQDSTHQALHIDRKRRRELQEKRIAMGHKPDDHEDENMNQNIR